MIIPDSVLRHVDAAGPNEARVAVIRAGGTIEMPTLIIVCSALGAVGLTGIIKHAVETAPTPEDKQAWKGLGLSITSAIIGAIGPAE